MNITGIIFYLARAATLALVVGFLWSLYMVLLKKKSIKTKDFAIGLLKVCYLTALIQITVIRDYGSFFDLSDNIYSADYIQYIPFATMKRAFNYSVWEFVYHVVGNIAWFLPFGVLYAKSNKLLKVTICGFGLSLGIELLQLVFNTGVSDVDDVITNTLGAVIGYILYVAYKKIFCKQHTVVR